VLAGCQLGRAQVLIAAIESVQFPGVFLRMDGSNLTRFTPSGGGTVNCQFGALEFETFVKEAQPDGSVAFRSDRFPKAFLRMDGTGVTSFGDAGAGTVNVQVGAGPFERFRIIPKP
jgi:hypothetical protein